MKSRRGGGRLAAACGLISRSDGRLPNNAPSVTTMAAFCAIAAHGYFSVELRSGNLPCSLPDLQPAL
jgi:hypothetical protein